MVSRRRPLPSNLGFLGFFGGFLMVFGQKWRFCQAKKKNMVIFQNVFSPKAASRQPLVFGDPENPEILEVQK